MGKKRSLDDINKDINEYDDMFTVPDSEPSKVRGLGDVVTPIRGRSSVAGAGDSTYDYDGYLPEQVQTTDQLNERRAEQQGGLAETGLFVGRALTKAGSEVFKLPGVAYGLAEWASTGFDQKEMHSALSNKWIEAIEGVEESIKEEVMPVYIKESVKNGDIWDNLGSGEFWATEGADGAGYLVAMMAPGGIIKGSKLFRIPGIKPFERLAANTSKFKYLDEGLKVAGKSGDDLLATATNTYVEAISEGREIYNEVYDKELQNKLNQGFEPGLAEQEARKLAGNAAAGTYKGNLAVLGVSNMIDRYTLFNGFGRTVNELAKKSALKIAGRTAGKAVGGGIKEGAWEEGAQFSIGEYYKQNPYGNTSAMEDVGGIIETYFDGFDDVGFQKSVALGAILGGGMQSIQGGIEDFGLNKQKQKQAEVLENNLIDNYGSINDLYETDENGDKTYDENGQPNIDPAKAETFTNDKKRAITDLFMMQEAAARGDKEAFDYIKNQHDFNHFLPALRENMPEESLKQYARNLATRQKEDAEGNGIPTEYIQDVENDLLGKIDEYKKIYDNSNAAHKRHFRVKSKDKNSENMVSGILLNSRMTQNINQKFISDKMDDIRTRVSEIGINIDELTDKQSGLKDLSQLVFERKITHDESESYLKDIQQYKRYNKDFLNSVEETKKLNNKKYIQEQHDQLVKQFAKTRKAAEDLKQDEELNSIPTGQRWKSPEGVTYIADRKDDKLIFRSEDGQNVKEISKLNELEGYEKLEDVVEEEVVEEVLPTMEEDALSRDLSEAYDVDESIPTEPTEPGIESEVTTGTATADQFGDMLPQETKPEPKPVSDKIESEDIYNYFDQVTIDELKALNELYDNNRGTDSFAVYDTIDWNNPTDVKNKASEIASLLAGKYVPIDGLDLTFDLPRTQKLGGDGMLSKERIWKTIGMMSKDVNPEILKLKNKPDQNSIEGKKADIEKRRKQVLNKLSKIKGSNRSPGSSWASWERDKERKSVKGYFFSSKIKEFDTEEKAKQATIDKINAKYDAELAALKPDQLPQQEKPSTTSKEGPKNDSIDPVETKDYNDIEVDRGFEFKRALRNVFLGLGNKTHLNKDDKENINQDADNVSKYPSVHRYADFINKTDFTSGEYSVRLQLDIENADNVVDSATKASHIAEYGKGGGTPIFSVIGKFEDGVFKPINKDGNFISDNKVGEEGIYAYMPLASTEFQDVSIGNRYHYPKELKTPEEFAEYDKEAKAELDVYKKTRDSIHNDLKSGKDVYSDVLDKSKGVSIKDTDEETGQYKYNPINKIISDDYTVHVSIDDILTLADGSYINSAKGVTYVEDKKTGQTHFAYTGRISDENTKTIVDLIENWAKKHTVANNKVIQPKDNIELNELKKFLYFTDFNLKDTSQGYTKGNVINSNKNSMLYRLSGTEIAYRKLPNIQGGYMQFNDNTEPILDQDKLKDGEIVINPKLKEVLLEDLPDRFYQVSNKLVKDKEDFKLPTGVVNGEIKYKVYPIEDGGYSKYLVDNVLTTTDIPKSNIKIKQVIDGITVENEVNRLPVKSQYAIISDKFRTTEKPEVEKVDNSIDDIFNGDNNLSNAGTKEQYAKYIKTIFPDSKVKDIVYHGTNKDFDKFKIPKNYGAFFSIKSGVAKQQARLLHGDENLIKKSALLNIKNPKIGAVEGFDASPTTYLKGFDGLIMNNRYEKEVLVVTDAEQIHILGSKQDIQGFKKFINDTKGVTKDDSKSDTKDDRIEDKTGDDLADGFDEFDDTDDQDDIFKMSSPELSSKERLNKEQALKYLEDKIGYSNVKFVNHLIDNDAWGLFNKEGLTLSTLAAQGVEYHEAFHIVSQLYLKPSERLDMYNEWRNINKNVRLKTYRGKFKLGSEFSNKEVEEALAEEFRIFTMTGYASSSKLKAFFQRMLNAIKKILGFQNDPNYKSVFKDINRGHYKQKQPITNLNDDKFYQRAIPNQSKAFTKTAIDSVNFQFFTVLDKAKVDTENIGKMVMSLDDIYGQVYNIIGGEGKKASKIYNDKYSSKEAKEQAENSMRSIRTLLNSLKSKEPGNLRELHQEQLAKYDVKIVDQEDFKNDQNKVDDSAGNYWAQKSIEVSQKDSAAFEVKSLLSVIPQTEIIDGNTRFLLNELGLPQSIEYNSVINTLFNKLAGSISEKDMVNSLKELSKKNKSFNAVINFFKLDKPVSNQTREDRVLINKFYNTFNKYNTKYSMLKIDDDGNIYKVDATRASHVRSIKNRWNNNSNSKLVVDGDDLVYSDGTIDKLESLGRPKTFDDAIKVLSAIGIKFTNIDSSTDVPDAGEVAGKTRLIYDNIVSGKTKNINADNEKINDNKSDYTYLANIEAATSIDAVENSHRTRSGDRVYNITLHTYMSSIISEINKYKNRADLIANNKHLNDKFLNSSILFKLGGKIFDTNGNVRKSYKGMEFNVMEDVSTKTGNKGSSYEDSASADKMLMYYNAVMKQDYPMLRASDNKLFRTFTMPKLHSGDIDSAANQMVDYLSDEILKFYDYKKSSDKYQYEEKLNSGPLMAILDKYGNSQLLKKIDVLVNGITDPITKETTYLSEEEILNEINELKVSSYTINGKEVSLKALYKKYLSDQIKNDRKMLSDEYVFKKTKNNTYMYLGNEVSEAKFNKDTEEFTINNLFSGIEQIKLFIGHPAYYKDFGNFFKRLSGPVGTKVLPNVSEENNEWVNTHLKRELDKKVNDKKTPTVTTATFADMKIASKYHEEYSEVIGSKLADKYYGNGSMNIGDGQGYITLDEYRDIMFRMGQWPDSSEDLYQWEVKYANATTKEAKDALLKDKPSGMLNPLKWQYFGPLAESTFIPAFYKLSLFPLVPSVIEGREIAKLNNYLTKKQIGIAVFESANKVGAKVNKEGNIQDIFDSEKNIGELDGLITQNTYMKYWGEQLHIEQKSKSKVTTGTQMMKHIFSGLLNEDGSFKTPKFQSMYNEYNSLNEQRIELSKNKLIKDLGLNIDKDGNYAVESMDMFKNLLKDEYIKRDMSEADIEALNYIQDNGIDVLQNRQKVESILYSLADSRVVRQKRSGTMAIQVSVAMMEDAKKAYKSVTVGDKTFKSSDLSVTAEDETLRSNDLAFYSQKNKTLCEVYLPSYLKGVVKLDEKLDDRLLKLIGFRIPTQGLNSIESMVVKDFLPEEAGNIIIMPDEIVAKAGSDFDIDKLNIYYPNVYYKKGKPVYHEYSSSKDKLEDRYKLWLKSQITNSIGNSFYEDMKSKAERSWSSYKGKITIKNKELKELEQDLFSFIETNENKDINILIKTTAKNLSSYGVYDVAHRLMEYDRVIDDYIQSIGYKKTNTVSQDKIKKLDSNADNAFLTQSLINDILNSVDELNSKKESFYNAVNDKYWKNYEDKLIMSMEDILNTSIEQFSKLSIYEQNSKAAIENRITELQQELLEAPENFARLISPISAEDLEDSAADVARAMEGDKKSAKEFERVEKLPFDNVISFETAINKSNQLLGAKQGVGIAANQSTSHILFNQAGIKIRELIKAKVGRSVTDIRTTVNLNSNSNKASEQKDAISNTSDLSVKNIFTVNPKQNSDKKAKSKASIATKYIGFGEGITGSSTALYADQAGEYANTGNYSSSDVIFASVPGKRGDLELRKSQQDMTIREVIKALDSGATVLLDNKSYAEGSSYNEGELRMLKNLELKGYSYSETTVDGNKIGVWKKSSNNKKNAIREVLDYTDISKNENINGRSIEDLLSQFINAYVDAAKDPYIFTLNAGPTTANTFLYLIRAGVSLEDTTVFMNQPIVREYLEELALTNSLSYKLNNVKTDEESKDGKDKTLSKKDIQEEVKNRYASKENVPYNKIYEYSELRKMIVDGANKKLTKTQNANQQNILSDFIRYEAAATEIRNLVQATTFDTAPARNTSDLLLKNETIRDQYNKDNFINFNKLVEKDSFIYPYRNFSEELESMYTDYIYGLKDEGLKKLLNLFVRMYNHPSISMSKDDKIRVMEKLRNSFFDYVMQKGSEDGFRGVFGELFRGSDSLPKRIKKLQESGLYKDNTLLESFIPVIRHGEDYDNMKLRFEYYDTLTKDVLVDDWKALYESDNNLAEDLVKFVSLQSGLQYSPLNFSDLIPPEQFNNLLQNNLDNVKDDINYEDFLNKFFRANYNDNNIIPQSRVDGLPYMGKLVKSQDLFEKDYVKIIPTGYKDKESGIWMNTWAFGSVTGDVFGRLGTKEYWKNRQVNEIGLERSNLAGNEVVGEIYSFELNRDDVESINTEQREEVYTTIPTNNALNNEIILDMRSNEINYTLDQKNALLNVSNFIMSDRQHFMLSGYAGTGKTTIAENIARFALETGLDASVLAPTNKAATVLKDKFKNSKLDITASTIHKALYGEPDEDTGKWMSSDLNGSTIYIIDESSMIDKNLLDDINEALPESSKIVFMGDGFQLEQIGKDAGLFNSSNSLYKSKNDYTELSEVKRQDVGGILETATAMRTIKKPVMPNESYGNLVIDNKIGESFIDSVKNGDDSIIIVSTNKDKINYNKKARAAKFGDNINHMLSGEPLMGIANTIVSNSEIIKTISDANIHYDDYVKINVGSAGNPNIKTVRTVIADVRLDIGGKERLSSVVLFPEIDMPSLYPGQIISSIKSELTNTEILSQFTKDTEDGKTIWNGTPILTYGYAITAHKSQGSEWDKVFIDQNYKADSWNEARWLYTALTRARNSAHVKLNKYMVKVTPDKISDTANDSIFSGEITQDIVDSVNKRLNKAGYSGSVTLESLSNKDQDYINFLIKCYG